MLFHMENKHGYNQFCPVALTSELICNRWTTLILRAFFCGATSYSDIQGSAPLMSSAILSRRLRELEFANIIEVVPAKENARKRYQLTAAGKALFPIVDQMGIWAQNWLRREITLEENMDPDVLFWELRQLNISRGIDVERRRVTEFNVSGVPAPKQRYWLIFEPDNIEICIKDPGHEVDLWITSSIKTLVEIWLGHVPLSQAYDEGALQLDGPRPEIEAFSEWFVLSHFAQAELERNADRR
ncbi:transcriptional regulator, HxlR family [Aliiroseovarius sediminilitoris]|uniref:Transcriptional regulator, HxlR family n=2 Tax=Aliiroseovarius sediminilitoris TaxID=1173584 RepID=A0A1I0NVA9_9RHOB|nr:transcriptional regulator, HxlR family [Aliiroseovarius sediminilitoris]